MFETLAGRLKWERTADGIRAVIPSRFSWFMLLSSGLWLLIFPHFTYEILGKSGRTAATWSRSLISDFIGFALIVIWIAMFRTHKCVLTLTPAEMRVEKWALGLELRTATCATSQLCDLRFIPSQDGITVEHQSRIQLRRGNKTRSFGVGIGEEEADALIAKMMEVYPFPECLPTQSSTGPGG